MSATAKPVDDAFDKVVKQMKKMTDVYESLMENVIALVKEHKGEDAVVALEKGKKGGKKSKAGSDSEKKPRKPSVWTNWVSHCHVKHELEYKEFVEAAEKKTGLAIHFAKKWREENPTEWADYEVAFKAEHSETASTEAGSEVEEKPKAKGKAKAKAKAEESESEAEAPKVVKKVVKKK